MSDVLGKKSSSTSKGSDNTMCWATVVGALWTTFQYQIKNQIKNHKCWRAKVRAELAHFTYTPYSCAEHWPYLGLNANVACTSHKALIGFCEFWNLVFSGIQREKQLSVQKTQKATLGSKANRTEMVATAQHKATSTIRIAEEEKSVQNLRSSATYLTLIVKVDAWHEHWEDLRGIELSRAK